MSQSVYEFLKQELLASACTVCLGNGTLASRDSVEVLGHYYPNHEVGNCLHCKGYGLEPQVLFDSN